MALHTAADGLGHQVSDLLPRDSHIRQPLARQQQLGGQGIGFLLPAGPEDLTRLGLVQGAAGDLHPLLQLQHLVG